MDRKSLSLELKVDSPEGSVQAVFSTFNVIDLDGDVTLPGAFTIGAPVKIAAWGHNWGALPVGKGTILADATRAILDGNLFLSTTSGKDTYETLKELGSLAEWSYGFDVIDSELGSFGGQPVRFLKGVTVHEACPVMVGAGIGTQTLAVKSFEDADFDQAFEAVRAFLKAHKEGRVLSAATRGRLEKHPESLRQLAADIDTLLQETAPPKGADQAYLDWQIIRARLNGCAV